MNDRIDDLTSSQQRILCQCLWDFEQALANQPNLSPSEFLARFQANTRDTCLRDGNIPHDLLLQELEEIEREHRQIGPVTNNVHERSLERYDLREEIARGGSSIVWRAWDRHLQRETAIKCLLSSQDNKWMRGRLEREARLCGRLLHPGIVPIHELSHFPDGRPFVSMKLIEGHTLSDLLTRRPPIATSKAIDIFQKVCEAMAYAHDRGIIHRDLKPGNIMVGQFGEVQIMDWGLGKDLNQPDDRSDGNLNQEHWPTATADHGDTQSFGTGDRTNIESTRFGSVVGTIAYMAPEQALGQIDHIDRRSDVFALGAILCRILIGHPPYHHDSAEGLLELARRGEMADCRRQLQATPHSQWSALALRCLETNPQSRIQDAGELVREIEAIRLKMRRQQVRRKMSAMLAVIAVSILILRGLSVPNSTPAIPQANNTPPTPKLEAEPLDNAAIEALLTARQFDLAMQAYRARMKRDPQDLDIKRRVCIGLLNAECFVDAKQLASELIEADPNEPEYYFLLSETQFWTGQLQSAFESMQQCKDHTGQGAPRSPLPADSKLSLLRQALDIERAIESGNTDHLMNLPKDQLVLASRVCDVLHQLPLAIKLQEQMFAIESDPKKRSQILFQSLLLFIRKNLRQSELSDDDRDLICSTLVRWLSELTPTIKPSKKNGGPPTELSSNELELIHALNEPNMFRFVPDAIQDTRVDPSIRAQLQSIYGTIQSLKDQTNRPKP